MNPDNAENIKNVEYVATRMTKEARECIEAEKIGRETISDTIIRCISGAKTQQLELSSFDTRKEMQELKEEHDSLKALVISLQTTVNNAINIAMENRITPLIEDIHQPSDIEIQEPSTKNTNGQEGRDNISTQHESSMDAAKGETAKNDTHEGGKEERITVIKKIIPGTVFVHKTCGLENIT